MKIMLKRLFILAAVFFGNYCGLAVAQVGPGPGPVPSQWTTSGANIYSTNSGNTGIGTSTPEAKLQVNGSIDFSGWFITTPQMFDFAHSICGGATAAQDQAAFDAAVAAAGPAGVTIPSGSDCKINASTTYSVPVTFQPNGMIQPQSGTIPRFTGSLNAGAWKIVDLSAGGHADFTAAKAIADVLWWGAIGGDTSYNSGHATTNKPLLDEAITYAPATLNWGQGYSTTGHSPGGSRQLTINFYNGSSSAFNVYGLGLAFSDAANATTTLPEHWLRYVFQNGPEGNGFPTTYNNAYVTCSDLVNCAAIGQLASTTTNLNPALSICGGQWVGYIGLEETLDYQNTYGCTQLVTNFIGNGSTVNTNFTTGSGGSAAAQLVPVVNQPVNGQTSVNRFRYVNVELNLTAESHGQGLYQWVDPTEQGTLADGKFDHVIFINLYDGADLNCTQCTYDVTDFEQIAHTVVTGEPSSTGANSLWINPTLPISSATFLSQLDTLEGSAVVFRNEVLGGIALGSPSPSTTQTGLNELPQMPTMSGTPTGAPSLNTGFSPFTYNTSAHRLQVYDGTSAWYAAQLGPVNGTIDFSINRASSQQTGILSATPTKVLYNTAAYDTTSACNLTTARCTPLLAGTYHVTASADAIATFNTADAMQVAIYKNGSVAKIGYCTPLASETVCSVSGDVALNGSSDYIEIFVTATTNTGNISIFNQAFTSYFDTHWAGP